MRLQEDRDDDMAEWDGYGPRAAKATSARPRRGADMAELRVLIGCETSGVMRRAFDALGHDAWSCDLLPAEDGSNRHIVCDIRELLDDGWDLLAVRQFPPGRGA